MKYKIIGISLLLSIAEVAFPQQPCIKTSARSQGPSIGANYVVEIFDVKHVRNIFGTVRTITGDSIPTAIVDVFRVEKFSKKSSPTASIATDEPFASYKVDADGQFCLADLSDGNYVLRIGTDVFAFAHSFIKVRKMPSGSRKPIDIELNVGN